MSGPLSALCPSYIKRRGNLSPEFGIDPKQPFDFEFVELIEASRMILADDKIQLLFVMDPEPAISHKEIPAASYNLTIEVTMPNGARNEANGRLWVSESGSLRFQKV
jgi:hypothetical protein